MYYPICRASSPRKKAISSTTMSSKVHASTASRALSTRLIWALPKSSPKWSANAPRRCPCQRPCGSLDCLLHCGPQLWRLACGICFAASGPRAAPALLGRTTCCWPPSIGSVRRDRRPKSPIGIATPSSPHSGAWMRSACVHKTSGMPSSRSCPPMNRIFPCKRIRSIRRSCVCSACGSKSRWSPPLAGLRHHQLLHIYRQQQRP